MQHQYTQNLELIPTRFPHVFNVQLKLDHQTRYIGRLDRGGQGTFIANRSEKHLHRKTNSLGVNLELLQRFDFKWIVITYCGQRLVTTRNFILYHGSVFNFSKAGFEKQCFLRLDLWDGDKASAFERTLRKQEELFEEVADVL